VQRFVHLLAVSVITPCSCSENLIKETRRDVLKRYEGLVLEMKAGSISQLFTNNSETVHQDLSFVIQKCVSGLFLNEDRSNQWPKIVLSIPVTLSQRRSHQRAPYHVAFFSLIPFQS
jgi:hypothetical protein